MDINHIAILDLLLEVAMSQKTKEVNVSKTTSVTLMFGYTAETVDLDS